MFGWNCAKNVCFSLAIITGILALVLFICGPSIDADFFHEMGEDGDGRDGKLAEMTESFKSIMIGLGTATGVFGLCGGAFAIVDYKNKKDANTEKDNKKTRKAPGLRFDLFNAVCLVSGGILLVLLGTSCNGIGFEAARYGFSTGTATWDMGAAAMQALIPGILGVLALSSIGFTSLRYMMSGNAEAAPPQPQLKDESGHTFSDGMPENTIAIDGDYDTIEDQPSQPFAITLPELHTEATRAATDKPAGRPDSPSTNGEALKQKLKNFLEKQSPAELTGMTSVDINSPTRTRRLAQIHEEQSSSVPRTPIYQLLADCNAARKAAEHAF